MSLDKAIEHGKEHRKPYRGGKAVAYSCRNHGDCDYCRCNRLHKRGNGQITLSELDDESESDQDQ